MLEGNWNKIGFLVVLLSACCWVIYITGFSLRFQQLDAGGKNSTVVQPKYFPHWCLSVSGVPLYFLFLFHLMCGNTVTAILALSALPLYLVALGGVLNHDGQYLYSYYAKGISEMDYQDYVWVEFIGGLGSLVFCWLNVMLWSCYWFTPIQRRRSGYERLH